MKYELPVECVFIKSSVFFYPLMLRKLLRLQISKPLSIPEATPLTLLQLFLRRAEICLNLRQCSTHTLCDYICMLSFDIHYVSQ